MGPSVLEVLTRFRRNLPSRSPRNKALDAALGVRGRFDLFAWLRSQAPAPRRANASGGRNGSFLASLFGRLWAAPARVGNAPARVAQQAVPPSPHAVRREPGSPRRPRWDDGAAEPRRHAAPVETANPFDHAHPLDHAHPRWDGSGPFDDRDQAGLAPAADLDPQPRWDDRPLDDDAQGYAPDAYAREPRWDDQDAGGGGETPHWQQAAPAPEWRAEERELPQGYLAVDGVEKSFGGRMVVKGASLYVRRGEAVGLLGPNGAGKTTIFYMITGLIKADRGRVELDGNDITGLPMYQRGRLGIGYLAQEASIFRGLTVEENIRGILEVVEPNRKKREAELDALLDEFNIARLRKTPAPALSGGERRRVEIARALASRPTYMLLDEPFAGIDPIAVGDIQALVRHLTQRGIGVLITDHNVRETLGLTDRAYIIYSGEVLMEGNTSDIVNDPEVRRLYLGEEFKL